MNTLALPRLLPDALGPLCPIPAAPQLAITRGGATPELCLIEGLQASSYLIPAIPCDGTAYAVDFSPMGDRIAWGTRTGHLRACSLADLQSASGPGQFWEHRVVSSITCICWYTETKFVAATTDGSMILCDVTSDEQENALLLPGSIPAVAMGRYANDGLVALCLNGDLCFVDLASRRVQHSQRGPSPGKFASLISLLPRDSGDEFLYPSEEGFLIKWQPGESLHIRQAHKGEIYCLFPFGDGFVSVGYEDGRFRLWPPSLEKYLVDCDVPPGVVQGAALSGEPEAFVLVDQRGRAAQYRLADARIQEERVLGGTDFRRAVALPHATYAQLRKRQKDCQIDRLAREVCEHYAADAIYDAETALLDLEDLGAYGDACLLRVHQAHQTGDIPSLVRHSGALYEWLETVSADANTILHCAELALKAWRPTLSLRLLSHVPTTWREKPRVNLLQKRGDALARAMAEGPWIGEIDKIVSFNTLVDIASADEAPLAGRYILYTREIPVGNGIRIPLKTVLEKWSQDGTDANVTSRMELNELHWMNAEACSRHEVLEIREQNHDLLRHLSIVVKSTEIPKANLITVALVVDCDTLPDSLSSLEHNTLLLELHQRATDSREADLWFKTVMENLNNCIWRITNEIKSSQKRNWD